MTRPNPYKSAFSGDTDWSTHLEQSDFPSSKDEALKEWDQATKTAPLKIKALHSQLFKKWTAAQAAAAKRKAKAPKKTTAKPRRTLSQPQELLLTPISDALKKRRQDLENLKMPNQPVGQTGALATAPLVHNVIQQPPRYFRALVWNLENFTADKRMKTTQAIGSARNMTRINVVADLACRLGADAVMIMETGSDIGTVTTRLANCWAEREKKMPDARPVEPLATSPTHRMPELPDLVDRKIFPAEVDKVGALREAGRGYRITGDLPVGWKLDMGAIRKLLLATSNSFALSGDIPDPHADLTTTLRLWAAWCLDQWNQVEAKAPALLPDEDDMGDAMLDVDEEEEEDEEEDEEEEDEDEDERQFDMTAEYWDASDEELDDDEDEDYVPESETDVEMGTEDDVGSPDAMDEESDDDEDIDEEDDPFELVWLSLDRLKDVAIADLVDDYNAVVTLCDAVMQARTIARLHGGRAHASAVAEVAQVVLLSCLMWCTRPEGMRHLDEHKELLTNQRGQPGDLVLMVMFLAHNCELTLEPHDSANGPLFTADGDMLLHALVRLDIVKRPNSETYAVAYRPQNADQRDRFFGADAIELGYSNQGQYGILQGGPAGRLLATQQPGNPLEGRAGLYIRFPILGETWIPFLIHHNRYSGSVATADLTDDHSVADNTIIARLRTIEDEVRLLAERAPDTLLVGDFNLPTKFVHLRSGNHVGTMRSNSLIYYHRYEMAAAGYLRRRDAEGEPRLTTLKIPRNIAKSVDKNYLSETYDAVYQPFDFMNGTARVRSATVCNIQMFFTPETLALPVVYEGKNNTPVERPLGTIVRYRIANLYSGFVRSISAALTDSEDWLKSLEKKYPNKRLGQRASELLEKIKEFQPWLNERDTQFSKALARALTNGTDDVGLSTDDRSSRFDSIGKRVKQLTPQIEKLDTPKRKKGDALPGPVRLKSLPELFTALINLEEDGERRLWCAYHDLVSDHLPLLVEVDLLA